MAAMPSPPYASATVASESEAASRVGVELLRRGGHAVDAAIATALALGVVQPDASGLGGGGFLVTRDAASGVCRALDFRERAPGAARSDMFLRDGKLVPGLSEDGGLAVAVPGQVAGLALAHRLHGRLPWVELFAGAKRLAAEGVPVSRALHKILRDQRALLRRFPPLASRFLDTRLEPLLEGALFRRPGLLTTLTLLERDGPAAFYTGPLASSIVAAVRDAGGILTLEDLSSYRALEREPVRGSYRDYELITMPPPSSGGAVLLEILGILDRIPGWPPSDPAAYHHLLIAAMKQGFADRATHFADPDFSSTPVAALLDPGRLRQLALGIDWERTQAAAPWAAGSHDDHGTSHISVVDAGGNTAAMTLTVNTEFGSKVVVPGTGIILNNQMDNFSAAPGQPNNYGLVQSVHNGAAPGKRPLSSMAPTIVTRGGQLEAVLGASGGPRIISGILQAMLNSLERGMSASQAVSAPRLHHQWKPDVVKADAPLLAELGPALSARGHSVAAEDELSCVGLVRRTPRGLDAGCDPRKGGAPDGY